MGELLERSELLADWTVDRCHVELHPEDARESLAAADGQDAPPADPAACKARHAERPTADENEYDAEAKCAEVRARMVALADELRSFPPQMLGVLGEEVAEDEDGEVD
ncbi:hypothetical protein [Streptomyces violascens]|uniref:hypothetical protein n=1 Tax=Streptomyces violascens TaxID=67381 RepID=UPI00167311D2|nr:hypothetical protein [Streptomyces violascens]